MPLDEGLAATVEVGCTSTLRPATVQLPKRRRDFADGASGLMSRARGVVCRAAAAGRVLLHRVGGPSDQAAFEPADRSRSYGWRSTNLEPLPTSPLVSRKRASTTDRRSKRMPRTLVQRGLLTCFAAPPMPADAAGSDCGNVG